MEQKTENITIDQILALDVATHCGYFSKHEAGTWNLTESRRRNENKMHGSFRTLLIDFIRKYDITQIVAEDVSTNRHLYDLRRLSELRGVLLEVCDELNLPEPEFVNPCRTQEVGNGRWACDKVQDGRNLQKVWLCAYGRQRCRCLPPILLLHTQTQIIK